MSQTSLHELVSALLDGYQEEALIEARRLCKAGVSREEIVTGGIESAMDQLDAKCTVEQFNLLEIMLVGRAVMSVMKELFPKDLSPAHPKGTVVVGTMEGDVHDVGKNILKIVLLGNEYHVLDCGKDCSTETLIDAAEREHAMAIGCSGLITTVVPMVRQVKTALIERGLTGIHVLAGGAALKQGSPETLNVDYVAESAFDGVRYLNSILEDEK